MFSDNAVRLFSMHSLYTSPINIAISHISYNHTPTNHDGDRVFFQKARRLLTWSWLRDWCVDWWHSGRDDDYDEEDDQTPSDVPGGISYGSTVSRSTSLNVIHQQQPTTPTPIKSYHAVNNNNRLTRRSLSSDSVSTL